MPGADVRHSRHGVVRRLDRLTAASRARPRARPRLGDRPDTSVGLKGRPCCPTTSGAQRGAWPWPQIAASTPVAVTEAPVGALLSAAPNHAAKGDGSAENGASLARRVLLATSRRPERRIGTPSSTHANSHAHGSGYTLAGTLGAMATSQSPRRQVALRGTPEPQSRPARSHTCSEKLSLIKRRNTDTVSTMKSTKSGASVAYMSGALL